MNELFHFPTTVIIALALNQADAATIVAPYLAAQPTGKGEAESLSSSSSSSSLPASSDDANELETMIKVAAIGRTQPMAIAKRALNGRSLTFTFIR